MGQNDFRKALEDVEAEERNKMDRGAPGEKGKGKEITVDTQVDLDLLKTNPDKLYPIIYYALKKTLAEWGEWLEQRPGKHLGCSSFGSPFIPPYRFSKGNTYGQNCSRDSSSVRRIPKASL